jgi:hypothetical protein
METNAYYKAFLVHWTYTSEEWKKFRRWGYFRRGLWQHFAGRLLSLRLKTVPEIAITTQKVWIGDKAQSFRDDGRRLKRINIRDTGRFNLIEITYEKNASKSGRLPVIYIPIPKGKLREAIEVHEALSEYAW